MPLARIPVRLPKRKGHRRPCNRADPHVPGSGAGRKGRVDVWSARASLSAFKRPCIRDPACCVRKSNPGGDNRCAGLGSRCQGTDCSWCSARRPRSLSRHHDSRGHESSDMVADWPRPPCVCWRRLGDLLCLLLLVNLRLASAAARAGFLLNPYCARRSCHAAANALMHPLVLRGEIPRPGLFSFGIGWGGPAAIILGHLVYGVVIGSLYTRPVGYRVSRRLADG